MYANNNNSAHLPMTHEFEFDLHNDTLTHLFNATRFHNIHNSSTNSSAKSPSSNDKYLFYGYPVVIPLALMMVAIIVCAVGGNIMVVLTILRHRGMRTRTNMFIVNLAVADILVAVLDMPVSLITIIEGKWVFGDGLCQLNGFTMALFLICSIHTLMYISVHKYISITRPFSRVMTLRRIKLIILASWLWATFCAIGPLVGWNHNTYKKGASQCGPEIPKGLAAVSHSALITTSNYIIPLAVMFFCYSRIFREIHVHMKRIRETSNIDLENSVSQQKKVATTLFFVLSCFLLCWTPFILYSNAAVLIKDKRKLPPILNPLAYWCGYFNSACNPIIYAFRSPSFRKGYKEIMCGLPSAQLTAVNSMSFRSRSGRGSMKSGSNCNNSTKPQEGTDAPKVEMRRQRTLLSQTSWRSMTFGQKLLNSKSRSHGDSRQDSQESQSSETDCGICGFWRPKRLSNEPVKSEVVPENNRPSLSPDIKEEDEEERDEKPVKDEEVPLRDHSPKGDIREDSEAEEAV